MKLNRKQLRRLIESTIIDEGFFDLKDSPVLKSLGMVDDEESIRSKPSISHTIKGDRPIGRLSDEDYARIEDGEIVTDILYGSMSPLDKLIALANHEGLLVMSHSESPDYPGASSVYSVISVDRMAFDHVVNYPRALNAKDLDRNNLGDYRDLLILRDMLNDHGGFRAGEDYYVGRGGKRAVFDVEVL